MTNLQNFTAFTPNKLSNLDKVTLDNAFVPYMEQNSMFPYKTGHMESILMLTQVGR